MRVERIGPAMPVERQLRSTLTPMSSHNPRNRGSCRGGCSASRTSDGKRSDIGIWPRSRGGGGYAKTRNSGTTRWRGGRCGQGLDDPPRLARRLQGLAQHDDVEGGRRIGVEVAVGVALDHDRPCPTQALTPDWLNSMPRAVDRLLPRQIGEQRAVSTADVEHPRARLDHLGDQVQIAPQLAGCGSGARRLSLGPVQAQDGRHVGYRGRPRCSAQPARNPRKVSNSSGSCSKNASWPVFSRDLDKADIGGDGVQRMHQLAAFRGREQPVAGKRDDAEPRAWCRRRPPATTRHARPRDRNNPSPG